MIMHVIYNGTLYFYGFLWYFKCVRLHDNPVIPETVHTAVDLNFHTNNSNNKQQ